MTKLKALVKKLLKKRLSLHLVMMSTVLTVLVLPFCSLFFLKIYESSLVRQTESELIAQAVFIRAIYKKELLDALGYNNIYYNDYGLKLKNYTPNRDKFEFIPTTLDLYNETILPKHPDGKESRVAPDSIARDVGIKIAPILTDAQRSTLSAMKILDYNGIVVSGKSQMGMSFTHIPEFQETRNGQNISLIRRRDLPKNISFSPNSISRNANINVYVALPIIIEDKFIGTVWVNRTPVDIVKVLYGKRIELGLAAIFLLCVTFFLALLTSYTVTRPIKQLIERTHRLKQGEKADAMPALEPLTKEIGTLSDSFLEMAKTIEHRSEYIKHFALNVSHEFKTPLTAMQGAVELLQEDMENMPVEQRKKFLTNIEEDVHRLRRLVDRLLELARADMVDPMLTPTDLLPTLEKLAKHLRHDHLDIQLENKIKAPLNVPLSEDVLEAILSNLTDNSYKHGASEVIITVTRKNNEALLTVQDNGKGISEGNREKLFTPFFTTRRDTGGTGLGLSIIQSLLIAHNGNIKVLSSDNGACFELSLPVAKLS